MFDWVGFFVYCCYWILGEVWEGGVVVMQCEGYYVEVELVGGVGDLVGEFVGYEFDYGDGVLFQVFGIVDCQQLYDFWFWGFWLGYQFVCVFCFVQLGEQIFDVVLFVGGEECVDFV